MEAALFLHKSHGLTVKARGGATTTPLTRTNGGLCGGAFLHHLLLLLASKARREHKGCSAERVSSSAPSVADFPSPPDQKDHFFALGRGVSGGYSC